MELENIDLGKMKGSTKDVEEFVAAMRALPEGTVEGRSDYGHFAATIGEGVIKMGDIDPVSHDEILYHIPEGATEIVASRKGISFQYEGHKYSLLH